MATLWDSFREGGRVTLDQALEVARNPQIFQEHVRMSALAVLGSYIFELVAATKKELANGEVQKG